MIDAELEVVKSENWGAANPVLTPRVDNPADFDFSYL